MKFRSPLRATGALKSIQGDEERALGLPWQDVIVDCMGPFAWVGSGEQHVCTYICAKYEVPKLEVYKKRSGVFFQSPAEVRTAHRGIAGHCPLG